MFRQQFCVYKWDPLIIQGYCLHVSISQQLTFLHIQNALLVKMNLGENTLEKWEAFTCKDDTSDKKYPLL